MEDKNKSKPGPKPETLKIEMLLDEAAKRLMKAPEKWKVKNAGITDDN